MRLVAFIAGSAMIGFILFGYGIIGWPDGRPDMLQNGTTLKQPSINPSQINPANIVFLGTSLTSGESWTRDVTDQLTRCARTPAQVTHLARPGASSGWGRKMFQTYLQQPGARTGGVLIIEFSVNDASLLRGMPLVVSQKNHENLIHSAQAQGYVVFMATMNPVWGINIFKRPGHRRYLALYHRLADETGVGLINTVPEWLSMSAEARQRALPDGLHPTSQAAQNIMKPAVLAALEPFICGR